MAEDEKNRIRTDEDSQILERFGEVLRKIRKNRGCSQEELAHLAGFSRSYYTELETGKRNISLLNLYRLAAALDCDPQELLVPSLPKEQNK